MNTIISNALLELAAHYVSTGTPFTITLDNHNNWDNTLPDRLKIQQRFVLNMENTDLTDSYVTDNGDVILVAGIDDIVYTKTLNHTDVHCIGLLGKKPLIVKQFIEEPILESKGYTVPTKDAIKQSISAFKKYNPEMFTVTEK